MASNPEEPNTQYAPLEERNNVRANRAFNKKVLVAVAGFCAVFALVIFANQSPAKLEDPTQMEDPDAIRVVDNRDLPPKQSLKESVALPSDYARISTVSAFNELIATSIVIDHKEAYESMQMETLMDSFLLTMGSQVPDSEGFVPAPKNAYILPGEHKHRLNVFQQNIQKILVQNAEEYARNPSADRMRFGITVHADWEEEEFVNTRFTLKASNISKLIDSIKPEKAKRAPANQTSPRKLSGCDINTGGTCYILSCSSFRHATCFEHLCICWDNMCNQGGICVPAPAPAPPTSGIKCSRHVTGPTRNQGRCGDCWAFSTAQQLRYMAKAKGQDPGTMSAQYLVDCMPEVQNKQCHDGVKGCCGGLPVRADMWLAKTGGLPTQAAYGPLLSDTHPFTKYRCKSGIRKKIRPSADFHHFTDETSLANGFCDGGAVSIAIAANMKLMHYVGGVFDVSACPASQIDHAVLYTGVDRTFDSGKPVHIVLNSWGSNWGVGGGRPFRQVRGAANGHVIFKFGENVCNILALATQPKSIEVL